MKKNPRPPIESLACPYEDCQDYGKAALGNLKLRKIYGKDHLRYLRCTRCSREFSERKNTPLWNSKVPEAKAISAAEHLAEGCSTKATARLVGISEEAVERLRAKLGEHAQGFHDERVGEVEVSCIEMDERHGYVGSKEQQLWEATAIDPKTKLVLALVLGQRDEALVRELMEDTHKRLAHPHDLLLMTDGFESYKTLFPEIFGISYRPPRKGNKGRLPNLCYRIPRTLAHVQVIKQRRGTRVVAVETRLAHGTWKRVQQELDQLGYTKPNLSAVERNNGSSRRMNAYLVRRTLAFARQELSRRALGWWGMIVQNWCRVQRGLRLLLPQPQGRKQYQQRTPVMAAGLTDHVWTVADVLRCPIYPRRG